MLDSRFIFLAAAIELIGMAGYAIDTLRGRTKPNRVTWLLWSAAPLIGFFAQNAEHTGLVSVFTLTIGLGPLMVLLASFTNKQAYWRISAFDIACGLLSVLALILWLTTSSATTAIILSIAADFLAALPTMIKAYRHPDTETPGTYLADIIAGIISLLVIKNWTIASYGFPLYVSLNCGIIYLLIVFPKSRLSIGARAV